MTIPGWHWILVIFLGLLQWENLAHGNVWWSLGTNPRLLMVGIQPMCTELRELSPGQIRACQNHHDHMSSIGSGARLGITECQTQFKNRRWNCTTIENDRTVFGPVLRIASREAAFMHAILAAGVVSAIARSCRDGHLTSCHCSKALRPKELVRDWIWGGCGDNIQYGYKFGTYFVDLREKDKNHPRLSPQLGRMLMNLHNNEAGRRAVVNSAELSCTCHGPTGSCCLRTCWKKLAAFRKVGRILYDKYENSIRVKLNRNRSKLVPYRRRYFEKPTEEDLVYLQRSPTYCFKNESLGILGTIGRECKNNSYVLDGCDIMCCGRGYKTVQRIREEECRCKFSWCCSYHCRTCETIVDVNTCR